MVKYGVFNQCVWPALLLVCWYCFSWHGGGGSWRVFFQRVGGQRHAAQRERGSQQKRGTRKIYRSLRPGEKLYEELLIEDAPLVTAHPRIRKAVEGYLPKDQLEKKIKSLKEAIAALDPEDVRCILRESVTEYSPSSDLVDNIYLEKRKMNL